MSKFTDNSKFSKSYQILTYVGNSEAAELLCPNFFTPSFCPLSEVTVGLRDGIAGGKEEPLIDVVGTRVQLD